MRRWLGNDRSSLLARNPPAFAQYDDFAQRCRTMNGPSQVGSCLNALRYDPTNAERSSRLCDGLLAISGRFVNDRFEGTGSAGVKATSLTLTRDR